MTTTIAERFDKAVTIAKRRYIILSVFGLVLIVAYILYILLIEILQPTTSGKYWVLLAPVILLIYLSVLVYIQPYVRTVELNKMQKKIVKEYAKLHELSQPEPEEAPYKFHLFWDKRKN